MTHENKFGMFIHWGIYALTELQDQALIRYDMDQKVYEALQQQFNPTEYDPEEWVLLAKQAGMKYICFTAKHHDGFCMWDTKYTDYSVMHTPYRKDVLKMLADACQKHGMLLSLYYSNPDWHHPCGYNPHSTHQWRAVNTTETNLDTYRTYVKNQITELLTGYGKIYTLFWDIPPHVYDPSLNDLVRRLQPDIYINDRGWSEGDFSTPERDFSTEGGRFFRMTEACNSLGAQSWGYRREESFYTIRHLRASIDHIMARGGSYLLNVGPTAMGSIAPEYKKRLARVGDWYNRMEGALECHEEDSFAYGIYQKDCIVTKKNKRTYLHFPNGLISSSVAIAKYPGLPKQVRLLNTNSILKASIELLPEMFDIKNGFAKEMLHIVDIPADDLADEPIVLEIEW